MPHALVSSSSFFAFSSFSSSSSLLDLLRSSPAERSGFHPISQRVKNHYSRSLLDPSRRRRQRQGNFK
uniref:Putative secreted protein n=1 Tax=Anopheles marajoara TaxID=58244 RepID=A0A2M4CFL7_9DIPT